MKEETLCCTVFSCLCEASRETGFLRLVRCSAVLRPSAVLPLACLLRSLRPFEHLRISCPESLDEQTSGLVGGIAFQDTSGDVSQSYADCLRWSRAILVWMLASRLDSRICSGLPYTKLYTHPRVDFLARTGRHFENLQGGRPALAYASMK